MASTHRPRVLKMTLMPNAKNNTFCRMQSAHTPGMQKSELFQNVKNVKIVV